MNCILRDKSKSNNPTERILINRGIAPEQVQLYTHLTDASLHDYRLLGIDNLKYGLNMLATTIQDGARAIVIVDSDADGFCSAALFINFLHKLFPSWVESCLDYVMHEGKQHGLADHMDLFVDDTYKMVICIDGGSNDFEEHDALHLFGTKVLILDHHIVELPEPYTKACIINNNATYSPYPNKELCGAGVVWQFCRYIDSVMHTNYADEFSDLVAIANIGDMMSLHSFETRRLISRGLDYRSIHNPFIAGMIEKNQFSLNKSDYEPYDSNLACTPMGAAFFIIPFINAITRSGTMQEKLLIFHSMLNYKANIEVPSTKRGAAEGEKETIVTQALRTVTNVKNRQTKLETAAIEYLDGLIAENNMLSLPALVFAIDTKDIPAEIRGLAANKLMAKYQRPVCILSEHEGNYEGSMRGYTKTGITSFRDILLTIPSVNWCEGHDNAGGLSVAIEQFETFKQNLYEALQWYSTDIVYYVDYIFQSGQELQPNLIFEIAHLNDYWGQDIDRAYIALYYRTNPEQISLLKGNTVKINLPNDISAIKFGCTDKEIADLTKLGSKLLVCKCGLNKWNGTVSPQLIIEDYQLVQPIIYDF